MKNFEFSVSELSGDLKHELNSMTGDQLVLMTARLVKTERKITTMILAAINEVERRRLFADLGFPSMFEWLTRGLGYSAAAAYRRIQAARLVSAVPSVATKIESGELNLTTLAQVQTVVRAEEKRTGEKISVTDKVEILESIESASSQQTDGILASKFPELVASRAKFEKIRAVGDDLVRVEIVMTRAQQEKIERVREIASHSHVGASIAEVIEVMSDDFLKRRDPLLKRSKSDDRSKRSALSKGEVLSKLDRLSSGARKAYFPRVRRGTMVQGEALVQGETVAEATRVKSSVRSAVLKRANGKCEFRNPISGDSCGSKYLCEVDHIFPAALGGTNEPENLRVLCRTHNMLMAERILGRAKMDSYRR